MVGQSSAQLQSLLIAALAMCSLAIDGCFSPNYQEGLACSETGACPEGQLCQNSVCALPGAGIVSPDAREAVDAADPVCEPGTQNFAFTGSIESFVVPDCVTSLTIEAFGGQGGGGRNGVGGGGLGARMKGDFAVTGGESLQVLVGGQGIDGFPAASVVGTFVTNLQQGGGTGGGGSYVVNALGESLLIAGGGGGATHTGNVDGGSGEILSEILIVGGPGQITEAGQAGGDGSPGGTAGSGGTTEPNSGFHSGTGGGGFLGDGIGNSNGSTSDFGTPNAPGSSFANGGAGGIGGSVGRNGAFGGGGSAGYTGGGGGGYSGGGTGTPDGNHGGGGGGSLNAGSNPDNSPGVHEGPGLVIISW